MMRGPWARTRRVTVQWMLGRWAVEALLSVLLVVLSYYYLMSSHPHNAASSTVFPVAKRVLERRPHVAGMAEYRRLQEECARDRSGFWLERARQLLTWQREPTVGLEGDFAAGRVRWFSDGTLNVAYNCVDRHDPERLAIIWEGDEPAHNRRLTYGELGKMTSQVAHWLHSQGVEKGDTVAIYMPMVPEVVVAMLACARIGAMHNVIFAGFSADSLADRIIDSKAKVLITADQGVRGGKILPLKATVDAALNIAGTDRVQKVLVYERTGASVPMRPGRDCLWSVQVAAQPTFFAPVMVEAENPLFMLYTSGSTGRPKGLVHTSAGYLLYAALTMRYSFDYHEGDIFGCLADVGWITGHSYVVYGPLANGATSVLFESTPTYPTASRYWDVVARLRITQLYTAPTVIRALKRFGGAPLDGYDLTSLRVIGTVGEPINPDAWQWYHDKVGGGECAVVDTYWQTETGGHIVAPLPGATPTKAGSATLPCIGISVRVLDQHTGNTPDADVAQGSGSVDGVLAVAAPWPGMARTIFGDHQKFFNTYFAPYPGHYFTGDRVHRDVDGYLWIRGRVDDVINVSGHRLSTAEIEAALGKHPLCAEAAVLGRPDDITGQSIWAFCIMKPEAAEIEDAILEKELIHTVRTQIGGFSAPQRALIVSDLPKTRSGKIMRRLIRKILEGVREIGQLGDTTTLNNPSIVEEIISKVHHH